MEERKRRRGGDGGKGRGEEEGSDLRFTIGQT